MDDLFGDISLFTLGVVSDNWSAADSEGIISAADGVSIEEEKTIRFSIVVHLDQDGQRTGFVSFISSNEVKTCPLSSFIFELHTLLPSLQQNHRAVIGKIFFESLYKSNFRPYDNRVGVSSFDAGGEIRMSEEKLALVPGSFLVCVSHYPASSFEVDEESNYGIDVGDQDPEENMDYGVLIFKPDTNSINIDFGKATEYLKELSSVGLLLNLIEKWNTVSIEPLDSAWDMVLKNIGKDNYAPAHTNAAKIARFVLNDKSLYELILQRVVDLSKSGDISYTFGVTEVASEWEYSLYKNKDEITALMETCLPYLNVENPSEMCNFIESVSNEYSGLRLANIELGKRAVTETLGRIQDAKLRAKFKIKGEKVLNNI